MAPGSIIVIYFQIYKNQKPENTLLQFICFYFVLRFRNILYLSLLDLTFAIDREGIDNLFIALGASVWLFVQVHLLGTCAFLLLDWYFGS